MLIGGATGALTAGLFKLGQSERIFKNVKIGEVKLSETKVGQALGKFLSKENSNKTLFKMLNKSVSIERAVIGTLTFGAHIGGQSGLRESLDNHYTKFWEKDKGGVSIEDVTKVQRDQNSGTSSSGSNEYVADNSNYGELYGETPDPFDRTEANFIDRAASAIEHLASGSGGVNYNTFTAGGMGSGMGYPEGEEENNEEEEEEEDNEENENILNDILKENPFALLEIDCDQIQHWQTLAQHTAPQVVLDKIESLPSSWANDFEIQSLDEANGTVVNLDYFSVNVTSLPNNPNTGQQFTADEMLDYMRRNFNDFVEGSTFEPYCKNVSPSICQQETDLWKSNNPLGSVIYIDIPGDDGVVVCTEYNNSYWYFMTMNAPYAGNHPVSGTRQFGYEQNANGSFNFFVRGVDRIDSNGAENILYLLDWATGDEEEPNPFFGADDLWESFQNNIRDFANNNGGTSSIISPVKNRVDWDKVKEVLNGNLPVSELGCD